MQHDDKAKDYENFSQVDKNLTREFDSIKKGGTALKHN